MNQPKDLIWNAITESAKRRFNFDAFEKLFATFGNDHVAENVLFLVIAGLAAGDSPETIAAGINGHLILVGHTFSKDALLKFIADRRADLGIEIGAAETAMASFAMGFQPPGVLVQVRSMLSKS